MIPATRSPRITGKRLTFASSMRWATRPRSVSSSTRRGTGSVLRGSGMACDRGSGAVSSGRRSASDTSPTRRPSASTTGSALIRCLTRSAAASLQCAFGATVIAGDVIASLAFIGQACASPLMDAPLRGSIRRELRKTCGETLDEVSDGRDGHVVHDHLVDLATQRAQGWLVASTQPEDRRTGPEGLDGQLAV